MIMIYNIDIKKSPKQNFMFWGSVMEIYNLYTFQLVALFHCIMIFKMLMP